MGIVLDLFYLVAALFAAPWLVYRLITRGDARELPGRFGARLGEPLTGAIWLHGSSAGEIALLVPLVEMIEQRGVDDPIVISAHSSTGLTAARRAFPGRRVIVFPLDLSFIVKRAFERLDPRLIVIVESEFWPNFLSAALRRRIPVVVVNGKISEQSYERYLRLPLLARRLRQLDLLSVQAAVHAQRFRSLGVPADRIRVTGNMKYDSAVRHEHADELRGLRRRLNFADAETILIGGSLHEREDAALIAAFSRLHAEHRDVRLIVVPRYPSDCTRAETLLSEAGLNAVRKSALDASATSTLATDAVLIVDTVGELRRLYGLVDIAFVGGSLFFRGGNKGGHNLMEPAVFGIPVLFGPYNVSFAETARALREGGGGFEVADQIALAEKLDELVRDPDLRRTCGRLAAQVIESRRGATRRNFELLSPLLDASKRQRLRVADRNSTMPPTLRDADS